MKVLECVYLFVKNYYIKTGEKELQDYFALFVTALSIQFNFMTIDWSLHVLHFTDKDYLSKISITIILFLAIILLYFYLKNKNIYKADPKQEILKYNLKTKIFAISYMCLTVALFIFMLFISNREIQKRNIEMHKKDYIQGSPPSLQN
jgi:hypothetical protein